MAFGRLEYIGPDIPADPEEAAKQKRSAQKANFEAGMTALKNKRGK